MRLSQVMGIAHDSVDRFLLRESYQPKNLFNRVPLKLGEKLS
jgi:hypothetical protein